MCLIDFNWCHAIGPVSVTTYLKDKCAWLISIGATLLVPSPSQPTSKTNVPDWFQLVPRYWSRLRHNLLQRQMCLIDFNWCHAIGPVSVTTCFKDKCAYLISIGATLLVPSLSQPASKTNVPDWRASLNWIRLWSGFFNYNILSFETNYGSIIVRCWPIMQWKCDQNPDDSSKHWTRKRHSSTKNR